MYTEKNVIISKEEKECRTSDEKTQMVGMKEENKQA